MKPETNNVHVAVAVIQDNNGRYLLTKRSVHAHQGGLWEFPGGKLEPGETVQQALKREIYEEVGLTLETSSPLIRINHDYGDKFVLLDVWLVDSYHGEAYGKEAQELAWVELDELGKYDFPAANLFILKALSLPARYMITGTFDNFDQLFERVKAALEQGLSLIQFRAHQLNFDDYFSYAKKLYDLCIKKNARILLNTPFSKYIEYQAQDFSHGIHLTAKELKSFNKSRPPFILSASVHNTNELEYAKKCDCDFIVVSPVKETSTHPGTEAIGWEKFRNLSEQAKMPVYALGGMSNADLMIAKQHGGQGISAISEFWTNENIC